MTSGDRGDGDVALSLAGVSAGYGRQVVLRDVTFAVRAGEVVGVVGPSGSGKTTLLRLLTGRADLHSGDVAVLGERIRPGRVPRGVGYVPQADLPELDFPLTCEQVVLLGGAAASRATPWFDRGERRRARELLGRLDIESVAGHPIAELSGGQRQRMFLARAMMRRCRALLLDEPTSGVDLASRRAVLVLLRELAGEGLCVVLTTHDLNWIAADLPRLICLNRRLVADGAPAQVLTPAVLGETYGAEVRVVRDGDRVLVTDPVEAALPGARDAS